MRLTVLATRPYCCTKACSASERGDPLSVALDFGGVLPTGSVGEHSSNAAGNSAWGFVGGLGATYFYEANRFDTEINFATFTEGAKDYEKGNRVRWNLGYAYALNDHWDIGAEATWEMGDESKYQGQGQKNAYVEWYAGPKATFKYKPWKLNVGLIAQAPIHRWYEGNKIGSDDYRFSLKLMKAFNFNKLFD